LFYLSLSITLATSLFLSAYLSHSLPSLFDFANTLTEGAHVKNYVLTSSVFNNSTTYHAWQS